MLDKCIALCLGHAVRTRLLCLLHGSHRLRKRLR